MKYISVKNNSVKFSFRESAMLGLAPDGGLFAPEYIPVLPLSFFENLSSLPFGEICFTIAKEFIGEEIPRNNLKNIIDGALNFPIPIVELNESISVLELFHGPTLAFKDFGARFMSGVMEYFIQRENREINILAATSGDTGSAVASGFFGIEGINVFILYPSGKVSGLQEKQLTALGGNVSALEIEGTFDDCQRLVKKAFVDEELKNRINLSSANSINIARLIPQTFYYFEAYKKIKNKNRKIFFSIPSGNLGNLTAGLIAEKTGLKIDKFISAVNSNSVFAEYINSGIFSPRSSVKTLSNAMDVGDPSNFARIIKLFNRNHSEIAAIINSSSYNDAETVEEIKRVYHKYKYILDPHGAVGMLALNHFISENNCGDYSSILLETAHPAKFKSLIDKTLNINLRLPQQLSNLLTLKKKSIKLSNHYSEFKDFLNGLSA